MSLVIFPRQFLVDINGTPRVGAKANFYQSGTTTPITVYTTGAYSTPHANPVLSVSGGLFPAVYVNPAVNPLIKIVITDAADVTLYTEDDIPTSAETWIRTSAENDAGVTPANYLYEPGNARRYGAVGDGLTDDTLALQRWLNVALYSGVAYLPATPSYYRITATLNIPNRGSSSGLVIHGDGRLSSRIVQETAGQDVFNSNTTWAAQMNDVTIADMSIEGVGVARYGIRCVAMSRSQFINLRILNCATAGIYTEDSILNKVDGCHILGNQDGILQTLSPNSIPNGWAVTNSIISSNTRYAINLLQGSGWCITGTSIEANAKGGIRILTNDGGLFIGGDYFEGNRDGTAGTFDISLGAGSGFVSAARVQANRFQGSASDANYYPIRVTNVNACVFDANSLGSGSRFLSFESATGAVNCRFGPLSFGTGGVDKTNGSGATYKNISIVFVHQGNALQDHVSYPNDGQNICSGNVLTYLQTSLAGSSTATRSPNTGSVPDEHNGQPVLKLVRNGGTAIAFPGSFTVSAAVNRRVRGNWCTFAIDVYVDDASAKSFTVRLTDGASQAYTLAPSASNAAGWNTYVVTGYFDTATTSITPGFIADQDGAFLVSNPRLYVGLDLAVMNGNGEANQFRGTAAPTAGTWGRGDAVQNSQPSAAGTPGWVCTAAGTPGTWKARANVAA